MNARTLLLPLLVATTLGGCNDNDIVTGADGEPTPTPTDEPTPNPTPTSTPVECMFYGVDSDSSLWVIDPEQITATIVGPTGVYGLTDIAITADNRMIGIGFSSTYELDPSTGAATMISAGTWLDQQNALDSLPDGRLLVGGGAEMKSIDVGTGDAASWGTLPGGSSFSGDIATATGTRAYGSATGGFGQNDRMYVFDTQDGTVELVGDLGSTSVYGLDYGCDGQLYALFATYPPKLAAVNETTAATTVLGQFANGPFTLWGAAGPATTN